MKKQNKKMDPKCLPTGTGRRAAAGRLLREDCVEFVPREFEFPEDGFKHTWDVAADEAFFACPVCEGTGHVPCDECKGRGTTRGDFCTACEGAGAGMCESCDGGTVANRPVGNVAYPLPEDFDKPLALAEKFNFVIVVKVGSRHSLAYAFSEWHMREVREMLPEMAQAYVRLGYLPPAVLASRLLDEHELDAPARRPLRSACRRSLATAAGRWTDRLARFDHRFAGGRRGRP